MISEIENDQAEKELETIKSLRSYALVNLRNESSALITKIINIFSRVLTTAEIDELHSWMDQWIGDGNAYLNDALADTFAAKERELEQIIGSFQDQEDRNHQRQESTVRV